MTSNSPPGNPHPFERSDRPLMMRGRAPAQPATSATGARLRELRLERRWTQAELAKHAGVSQSLVNMVERGELAHSHAAEKLLRVMEGAIQAARDPMHRIGTTLLNWTPERQALLNESPSAFAAAISAIVRAARPRAR